MSIYAKLLAAQKAIAGIDKTGHNKHFDYTYFEEREVLRVARAALNDSGLAFFYSVEDVSDREVQTKQGRTEWMTDVFMVCTLYDGESGESVTGKAIGRGQDGQDKGINKAIVAGLKYWMLKTLMIPTGDDTERTENTNPEGNEAMGANPMRKLTGEGPKGRATGRPKPSDAVCPQCGGGIWDNRKDKRSARAPDYKCKDKEGCDWALWVDGEVAKIQVEAQRLADAGAIKQESVDPLVAGCATGELDALEMARGWLTDKARDLQGAA